MGRKQSAVTVIELVVVIGIVVAVLAINEDNGHGLFSFHENGVNILLADGAVRFLGASVDKRTLRSLISRAGDD